MTDFDTDKTLDLYIDDMDDFDDDLFADDDAADAWEWANDAEIEIG